MAPTLFGARCAVFDLLSVIRLIDLPQIYVQLFALRSYVFQPRHLRGKDCDFVTAEFPVRLQKFISLVHSNGEKFNSFGFSSADELLRNDCNPRIDNSTGQPIDAGDMVQSAWSESSASLASLTRSKFSLQLGII